MSDSLARSSRPLVVLVTGASAGVGRAVARAFARRGDSVGLVARGMDGLEGAKRDVERLGGRAVIAPADVADEAQLEAAAVLVERELGPIDIWVNNAMASVFARADDVSPEEFRRVTDVTYLGYVWGTLAALRRMKPRDRGIIVQVGSALAYRAIPLQSAYCASKHAAKGFTQSVRTELMHDGSSVEVVMVDLPALNTPQFDWSRSRMPRKAQPVPPIFEPEVAAEAIVHAALNPRRQVLVGWPTVKAVFAEKLAPGVADWYLARTGFEGQQTSEAASLQRKDNLFGPLPGDRGARGRFGDRAKSSSAQVWLQLHRSALAFGTAAAASAIGLAALGVAGLRARRGTWLTRLLRA
jgi:NAD(P)-dependent dehydrogenase (short-subunit alcohol dehydrogenase family)